MAYINIADGHVPRLLDISHHCGDCLRASPVEDLLALGECGHENFAGRNHGDGVMQVRRGTAPQLYEVESESPPDTWYQIYTDGMVIKCA